MASLGEVAAVVAAACDKASQSKDALDSAEQNVQDALVLFVHATEGDGTGEAEVVSENLREVLKGCKDLWQALNAGMRHAQAVLDSLVGIGSGRSATAAQTPVRQPTRVRDALAALPVRSRTNRRTDGMVLGRGGAHDRRTVSGRDEDFGQAADTLRGLGLAPARGDLWAAEHVEVKAAVHLRRHGADVETLVVNNQPCDTGPWSCDTLLPQVLRPGQRLIVHWPGGTKHYRGKAP
ncbi:DddA-like double-stranded DNA deaminase toxin [Actinosynnema sp. NPDC050436]|uniref:DddA-like double-stranded DNA deaminase toxin n=1 Tax=Actinosynnema sp. NPDC050436 TaxID=3155659 RepID=UPI0033E00C94